MLSRTSSLARLRVYPTTALFAVMYLFCPVTGLSTITLDRLTIFPPPCLLKMGTASRQQLCIPFSDTSSSSR